MTYCAGTGMPLTTALSQINPAHVLSGISSESILIISPHLVSKLECSCPSHPCFITMLGTIFMPLLFIVLESMFLCIVYANAFQRSHINNIVYDVKYFYLSFTSSGVIFLKQCRYCSNFKIFPKV